MASRRRHRQLVLRISGGPVCGTSPAARRRTSRIQPSDLLSLRRRAELQETRLSACVRLSHQLLAKHAAGSDPELSRIFPPLQKDLLQKKKNIPLQRLQQHPPPTTTTTLYLRRARKRSSFKTEARARATGSLRCGGAGGRIGGASETGQRSPTFASLEGEAAGGGGGNRTRCIGMHERTCCTCAESRACGTGSSSCADDKEQ